MEDYTTENVPEPEVPRERGSGFARFLLDILQTLVLSALLFAGINAVSARIRVDGYSMEPTLENGEFVIVNKLAYSFGRPRHGDVVVFRYPLDPQQEYIKRVVGVGGDRIHVSNGQVFVNGEMLVEPYIFDPPDYHISEVLVPEGSLYVMGDNRNNSSDSHNWGPVQMDYVIGKALFVYWPPDKWGLIGHPITAHAAP